MKINLSKGVQKIFSEVPGTYELINHILTFGLDIIWRKKAAKLAAKCGGTCWIDMCCGTGEMAACLNHLAKQDTIVVATDFSRPMLAKAITRPTGKPIKFILSDIKNLPFADNRFDLVTISFATRNINLNREILVQSFREFHRVLKPGGCFINLETSQPPITLLKKLLHFYARVVVKPIGSVISGSKPAYTYLSKTIPGFYSAEELVKLLQQAGFQRIHYQKLLFGVAAIHQGYKL